MIDDIENRIGADYTPDTINVLRFLKMDLMKVKCVWLGQDPYKSEVNLKDGKVLKVAIGRSFQPSNLTSWFQPFKQVSLKNIIRLIYTAYNPASTYMDIKSYKVVTADITEGKFPILEPREWFDSLTNQGVMFLNTYLTCKIGESNSHKDLWYDFSKEVIKYMSAKNTDIIWFLWGKEAISNKEFINKGIIYESRHPMMCSNKYEDDFLKSACFEKTKHIINWLG
jgi:uracil-DNA glycosylase